MISNNSNIDKKAKISTTAKIGPYVVIGPEVEIGENVEIHSHVHIVGNTKIGDGTVIFPFASTLQPKEDSFNRGLIGIPHRVGSVLELSSAP